MKPDRELANDILLGMASLLIENTTLKTILSPPSVLQVEKIIANAKTDRGIVRDALDAIAPLHAELTDADTLAALTEKYIQMRTHFVPPTTEVH